MTDLTIEEYSEKAIVVRGDTKEHRDELKLLGGKWNDRLRGGPGWIFSKKFESKVEKYVNGGSTTQKKMKHVETHSSPPFTVSPSNSCNNLLTQVESELKGMTSSERLEFIGKVAQLANATTPKRSRVRKLKALPVKVDVEESSDDEETKKTFPRARLLG